MSKDQQGYGRPSHGFNTGELIGVTAEAQMPDIDCQMVNIKASSGNPTFAYIGLTGIKTVTGGTDTATGWQLDAGEETGWIPIKNLSLIYYICDSTSDDLLYMVIL